MRYCISLDWLQLFCEQTIVHIPFVGEFLTGSVNNFKGYKYQYEVCACMEADYKYNYSFTIKRSSQPVLHIHFSPKSSAIRANAVSIKMANNILYTNEWSFLLLDICKTLRVDVLNITRADVALDCNQYYNGMHPKQFIHQYVSGDSIIRKGSNKFAMIGTKGGSKIKEEYLRFGSRASACSAYLYDKSRELRKKKYKPYIVKAWEDAGLNCADVWRTELSITSKGLKLRNESGKVRKLSVEDLATQANLQQTFFTFAKQYWMFHSNEGQKHRKNMQYLQLMPAECINSVVEKPSFLHEWKDSGRAERCAAKTCERLNLQIKDLDIEERVALHKASIVLERIGSVKKVSQDYKCLTRFNDYLIEHFKGEQISQDYYLRRRAFKSSEGVVACVRKMMIDNQWRI